MSALKGSNLGGVWRESNALLGNTNCENSANDQITSWTRLSLTRPTKIERDLRISLLHQNYIESRHTSCPGELRKTQITNCRGWTTKQENNNHYTGGPDPESNGWRSILVPSAVRSKSYVKAPPGLQYEASGKQRITTFACDLIPSRTESLRKDERRHIAIEARCAPLAVRSSSQTIGPRYPIPSTPDFFSRSRNAPERRTDVPWVVPAAKDPMNTLFQKSMRRRERPGAEFNELPAKWYKLNDSE
ncbi:hypothetical protein C8R47DRAFT_1078339 [Mycena vitilis]|nr:hypothetical protein C8R47DRAFT_1078339 [Mycena vitilis]